MTTDIAQKLIDDKPLRSLLDAFHMRLKLPIGTLSVEARKISDYLNSHPRCFIAGEDEAWLADIIDSLAADLDRSRERRLRHREG